MSEMLYSSTESETKRKDLGDSFETINNALDKINEIVINDSWQCLNEAEVNSKFEELKTKIPKIKATLLSYEEFLGVVKNTYADASDEIDSAVSTYVSE